MNKYEKIYAKAAQRSNGSTASWLDSAIAALAVDLEEYFGEDMSIGGPYGLRAEVVISSSNWTLTVSPCFTDGKLRLYYDTGEIVGRHPAGSIGELNGFNNAQAPLPDDFEDIANVMTLRKHGLEGGELR